MRGNLGHESLNIFSSMVGSMMRKYIREKREIYALNGEELFQRFNMMYNTHIEDGALRRGAATTRGHHISVAPRQFSEARGLAQQ